MAEKSLLVLPAPPTPAPRGLAERIVFYFHGPATWPEWDAALHYRLDWQHLMRRVQEILEDQPR